MVEHLSDKELENMKLGGHDALKVYSAYKEAQNFKGKPTVILARTIKGYGLGEAGEGRNITHNQKKLNEEELLYFRDRFNIPMSDEEAMKAPFYRFDKDSTEYKYLKERRDALGGPLPIRTDRSIPLEIPDKSVFKELLDGTGKRELSTTMAFVRLLTILSKDKIIGKHIVPIIPDEGRTFGMEPLFRQLGIYAHKGCGGCHNPLSLFRTKKRKCQLTPTYHIKNLRSAQE